MPQHEAHMMELIEGIDDQQIISHLDEIELMEKYNLNWQRCHHEDDEVEVG